MKKKERKLPIVARKKYEAERRYRWLTPMLDAYAQHAEGHSREQAAEEARRRERIACGRGCAACCENAVVPITPFEMRVISWFAAEHLETAIQDRLKPRLLDQRSTTECPFLLDRECSIHPVRPLACRGLIVFREPCKSGEHILESRAQDVFTHSRNLARKVSLRVLDTSPLKTTAEKLQAFEGGIMEAMAIPIHQLDLSGLARAIDAFRAVRSKLP